MRELSLGGQLFKHTFICAKVKYPIQGCESNGLFLTQIWSDLFILPVHHLDDGVVSAAFQSAELVLVRQERHKLPLFKAYRGLTRSNHEDQVSMYWKEGTCLQTRLWLTGSSHSILEETKRPPASAEKWPASLQCSAAAFTYGLLTSSALCVNEAFRILRGSS